MTETNGLPQVLPRRDPWMVGHHGIGPESQLPKWVTRIVDVPTGRYGPRPLTLSPSETHDDLLCVWVRKENGVGDKVQSLNPVTFSSLTCFRSWVETPYGCPVVDPSPE